MSGFTGFGRTSDIDFGDYVEIEMHRYGATNEFYIHKVIGAGRSNGWVETPLKWNSEMVLHDDVEDVLNVIQSGCAETIAFKVNKKDCKKLEVKNQWN